MAATARQSKGARKNVPDTANRRQPAWTTRGSPTFSPPSNVNTRLPNGPSSATQGTFPPLGAHTNGSRSQDNAHDRVLQSLAGLTGTTITLSTKTSQRYEGVIFSTSGEGDTTGVTLKDVKELGRSGAPLKDILFIASTNIESWQSGPADAKMTNGDSFRTDTDISAKSKAPRERELQAWQPSNDEPTSPPPPGVLVFGGQSDELTFGTNTAGRETWDQFEANEKLFGVKTNFDEDLYTTKLDRSAADFKEREREAQRIANEIIGGTTNNPHIAEERNLNRDDSGMNEEDKYGAVVRGSNAYVPPGARKQQQTSNGSTPAVGTPAGNTAATKQDIPQVSVNAPDGTPVPEKEAPPAVVKSPSPAPSSSASSTKPPADAVPAFRDFVTHEKQRLAQKKQALAKSEMDKRKAELLEFSQKFKLNKPIPDDLVPILAKDEDKQKKIRDKASKDAASASARAIGTAILNTSPSASRMLQLVPPVSAKLTPDSTRKPTDIAAASQKTPGTSTPPASKPPATKTPAEPAKTTSSKPSIGMFIQPIPPFKGMKARSSPAAPPATPGPTNGSSSATPVPSSPTTVNRLNANASSFRPHLKGPTSPIASNASASTSPKVKPAETSPPTPNPFFGTRPIKKGPPVHIKDDFNPFKHKKVADPSSITAIWPYNGKRYMSLFPTPQHPPQQPQAHMPPPGPPPPIQHPGYPETEGDPRYIYYAPYYPTQAMMSGMAPPPHGAYVSAPFMQPMPYPPGMPPPNGQPMYAASPMPQMPPYMSPPPGSYPPPPNGAGPRPSMPPTPIPTHPFYHQSPQLQHAVPYPIMMPPPGGPNVPPISYENAPVQPVQMGGVGHA